MEPGLLVLIIVGVLITLVITIDIVAKLIYQERGVLSTELFKVTFDKHKNRYLCELKKKAAKKIYEQTGKLVDVAIYGDTPQAALDAAAFDLGLKLRK